MPGHLNEPHKAKYRYELLGKGVITQGDIDGNVAADKLADQGADAHLPIHDLVKEMHDKMQITITIQKMLLDIWENYILAEPACMEADQLDVDELDKMMQNAALEAQFDDDYNPFDDDPCELNTRNIETAVPKSNNGATASSVDEQHTDKLTDENMPPDPMDDLAKRFPGYGWAVNNDKVDTMLKVDTPDVQQLNDLAKANVLSLRTYDIIKKNDNPTKMQTEFKEFKKYIYPISWWEPIAEWIRVTKWSNFGLCDHPDGTPKQHMRSTWVELVLLFQMQTGYRIRDQLDLASMERAFRVAFRRVVNMSSTTHEGKKVNFKQTWNPAPSINSLKHIIGHTRTGI